MYVYLLSVFFYASLSSILLTLFENSKGYTRESAFNKTFDVINFINSVVATVASSLSLHLLGPITRYEVSHSRSFACEDWTIETVCGYITAELLLVAVTSYRLMQYDWTHVRERYKMMEIFHVVALAGLASVMYFDTGYPLAMWVIWTELTTVIGGIHDVLIPSEYTKTQQLLNNLANILFLLQRILLYLYLVWLSAVSLVMEAHYIIQFAILILGTVLNFIIYFNI